MTKLDELRRELDVIDDKIAALFARRMDIGRAVGLYKKHSEYPVNDPGRETAIIKRIADELPPLSKEFAPALMQTLFSCSKAVQKRVSGNYYVIGKKLPHSWSPEIYTPLGLDYGIKELPDEEAVKRFVSAREFNGINVTIPYKQTVIPLLDYVSDEAREVGAVNTIVNRDGKLYGYNTDVGGMTAAIAAAGINPKGMTAAVFGGNGGTAHTARYVLKTLGARQILTVSRTGDINYNNVYDYPVEFIINATPVGMYPRIESSPADPARFPSLKGVFDAVYNPLRTVFVEEALASGIPAANGLYMLVEQGRLAYELFTDTEVDKSVTQIIADSIAAAKTNIVLTGMPGAGKTSVGRELSAMTGREFIDLDDEIERAEGRTIPEIFAADGEDYFRAAESRAVAEASAKNGVIIATGGGAVMSNANRLALKRNGYIVYIKRDIKDLPSDGRPVSRQRGAEAIYNERKGVYESFADLTVENVDILSTAQTIATADYKRI